LLRQLVGPEATDACGALIADWARRHGSGRMTSVLSRPAPEALTPTTLRDRLAQDESPEFRCQAYQPACWGLWNVPMLA
jgi:hypothetical protein